MNKVRQAVGALIKNNNEYLMIHKVFDVSRGKQIEGYWDIPKGAIETSDKNKKDALLRELYEETGSRAYKIIKEYSDKISFDFPQPHKYSSQETSIFLVEYIGDGHDLIPVDNEISDVKFFNRNELMELINLRETQDFLKHNEW